MTARRRKIALVLMSAGLLCGSGAVGLPANQNKPSNSNANINAIGRRDIGGGPDFYSLEHEKDLGKQLANEVKRSAKLVDDPEITQYVDHIGQALAQKSDVRMPVTFHVIDSDEIDAFTLPGGYQYINRGLLLELNSEAELAGVLAHGLALTALRSATREATRADIAQLAAIPAMIYVPNQWPASDPRALQTGLPSAFFKQRRDDEFAADYFGLQYMYVSGYDPECYAELLKRIWPQVPSGVPVVLSTSPPLPDRLTAMREEIVSILPKRDNAVVSTPAFTDFQQRVREWKPRASRERR